ncbi:MAG TPA: glycoside hydrolase family 2 TIM barrel-domain containing protein [Candidatus Binatia bacterium]
MIPETRSQELVLLEGDMLDPYGRGYPRPQLQRDSWISLNGRWEFALDPKGATGVLDVVWRDIIEVPFSPETARSGIHDTGMYTACWYRRRFVSPPLPPDKRLLLHFGAVDHHATVWLNGQRIGEHEGGYTPFQLDITDYLVPTGEQVLVVRAEDDPLDLEKPRGKQDWQREPHAIWYPRTTGIWQTVWLEVVPPLRIDRLAWNTSLEHWECSLDAWIRCTDDKGLQLSVTLSSGGSVLARDSYEVLSREVHRRLAFSDPGIDDYRNELLWSPRNPKIIDAELQLRTADGKLLDRARSYTAIRSVALEGDRFVLNGRPYFLRMALDQGYWPESGLTAPDDAALVRDVMLARAMGFNGVRKHQKVEDPRYLYWADRLGMLVWEEMPSAYRFSPTAVARVTREWERVLARDSSHPCIIAWVPINESWGVPNLPQSAVERHYIEALYHLTKSFDPTRPVVGNDGWESVATDIIGVHDYDPNPDRLRHRYHGDRMLPHLLLQERPGGRRLVVGDRPHADHPVVLSEFGGIKLSNKIGAWGYHSSESSEDLARLYERLMDAVRSLGLLTGFCYTQFTDTYQEANGLLDEHRNPKFPIERIRAATMGPPGEKPVWA